MSCSVLEVLCGDIKKSRNLAYFGRYSEAKDEFGLIIQKIQKEIIKIKDTKLIQEWNRLLQSIKKEKTDVEEMIAIMSGCPPPPKPIVKQNDRMIKQQEYRVDDNYSDADDARREKKKFPYGIEPFKKYYEDDEVYNKKKDENKEEKDPLDWGPPPPRFTKPKKDKLPNKSGVSNNPNPVDLKKRDDYSKPWQVNAKKPGKPQDPNQKKTYLNHVYPQGSGPDADLINMLERQVVDASPNVSFQDIAELEKAKELLEEAVLMPLHMPHLFRGNRTAWKGVMLYGPPGTGKTMLAKAIASTGKTTFFNVTSSTLASKWKGESEKLVRILFEMAKFYAPTTLFIDEIDALAGERGAKDDDSSRKVKTQLLTKMDGVNSGDDQKKVVVIGATNRPWDLDPAVRRRLEKIIYIPLPTEIGRRALFNIRLKEETLAQDFDLQYLIKNTDGYSGADISKLCREAAHVPMRRKLKQYGGFRKIEDKNKFEQELKSIPLTMDDFKEALKNSKPTVNKADLEEYEKWTNTFGEMGAK